MLKSRHNSASPRKFRWWTIPALCCLTFGWLCLFVFTPGTVRADDPSLHIFVIESGTPVDCSSVASYDEGHLFLYGQVIGTRNDPSDPDFWDANGTLVGYLALIPSQPSQPSNQPSQ